MYTARFQADETREDGRSSMSYTTLPHFSPNNQHSLHISGNHHVECWHGFFPLAKLQKEATCAFIAKIKLREHKYAKHVYVLLVCSKRQRSHRDCNIKSNDDDNNSINDYGYH